MRCPACYHEETKVLDSRPADEGMSIRRRRECLKCQFRFSTYEEVEILDLLVEKRDKTRQPYSRDKLTQGLKLALEKRPVSDSQLKMLVNLIERDLQVLRQDLVTSREIGSIVLRHLKDLDQVAYIRFASVYEDFQDIATFQKELSKLLKS